MKTLHITIIALLSITLLSSSVVYANPDLIAELEAKIAELEAKITELQEDKQNKNDRIAELRDKLKAKTNQTENQDTKLQAKLDKKNAVIAELEETIDNKDAKIKHLKEKVDRKIDNKNQKLDAMKAQMGEASNAEQIGTWDLLTVYSQHDYENISTILDHVKIEIWDHHYKYDDDNDFIPDIIFSNTTTFHYNTDGYYRDGLDLCFNDNVNATLHILKTDSLSHSPFDTHVNWTLVGEYDLEWVRYGNWGDNCFVESDPIELPVGHIWWFISDGHNQMDLESTNGFGIADKIQRSDMITKLPKYVTIP